MEGKLRRRLRWIPGARRAGGQYALFSGVDRLTMTLLSDRPVGFTLTGVISESLRSVT